MFYSRKSLILATLLVLAASMIIYRVCFSYYMDELQYPGEGATVMLWWTAFGSDGKLRNCGDYVCYFTSNRTFQYHRDLKSIFFYGSEVRVNDLPSWKSEYVSWSLVHEESPRNNPILVHPDALNLFNYSSTFSRFSDVPLTLLDLPGKAELLGKKYFVSTVKKNELMQMKNLAPLLYIQSDCDTASNRDSYVSELMKYIRVDSYGACLNNANLDERLKENYLEALDSDKFLSFVAKYKFTIAFENAICQDYITEKLWRPLIVGSVPVYYGSPSFKDWLPNNKSAISILDFEDPMALGKYLQFLLGNDTEYNKYLSHKLLENYEVNNERLTEALEKREKWSRKEFGSYIEEFECFVCKDVQVKKLRGTRMVDVKQYDCPLPSNPPMGRVKNRNWWYDQWIVEKCSARILAEYLKNNITFNMENFERSKLELYDRNQCDMSSDGM